MVKIRRFLSFERLKSHSVIVSVQLRGRKREREPFGVQKMKNHFNTDTQGAANNPFLNSIDRFLK